MNISTDVTSGEIKDGQKNKNSKYCLQCLPHVNCSCLQCDFKQVKLFQCCDVLADCEGPWLYPSLYLKKLWLVTEKLKRKQSTLNLCPSSP